MTVWASSSERATPARAPRTCQVPPGEPCGRCPLEHFEAGWWGDVAERQILGGRWLARQQRTRRPINSERGRIIASTPVRGVTFPLMHWSETSSHVKRWVGETEGRDRREKLDCREQLIKSLFLSFYELALFLPTPMCNHTTVIEYFVWRVKHERGNQFMAATAQSES